jgi:hypothetical protein
MSSHNTINNNLLKFVKITKTRWLNYCCEVVQILIAKYIKEIDNKTEFTLIHGGWDQIDTITKAGQDSSVIRERMNGGLGVNR